MFLTIIRYRLLPNIYNQKNPYSFAYAGNGSTLLAKPVRANNTNFDKLMVQAKELSKGSDDHAYTVACFEEAPWGRIDENKMIPLMTGELLYQGIITHYSIDKLYEYRK